MEQAFFSLLTAGNFTPEFKQEIILPDPSLHLVSKIIAIFS